jgi:hypothetical protein
MSWRIGCDTGGDIAQRTFGGVQAGQEQRRHHPDDFLRRQRPIPDGTREQRGQDVVRAAGMTLAHRDVLRGEHRQLTE